MYESKAACCAAIYVETYQTNTFTHIAAQQSYMTKLFGCLAKTELQ